MEREMEGGRGKWRMKEVARSVVGFTSWAGLAWAEGSPAPSLDLCNLDG